MKNRKKYFDNDDVDRVYNEIDFFAFKYQKHIEKCYYFLYNKNNKTREELVDFTYLKIVPYNMLEILVNKDFKKAADELKNLESVLNKYDEVGL